MEKSIVLYEVLYCGVPIVEDISKTFVSGSETFTKLEDALIFSYGKRVKGYDVTIRDKIVSKQGDCCGCFSQSVIDGIFLDAYIELFKSTCNNEYLEKFQKEDVVSFTEVLTRVLSQEQS